MSVSAKFFDVDRAPHPGATGFDVEDRLAIINVINSYADSWDSDDMDRFFTLFTKNAKCAIYLSDSEPNFFAGEEFRAAFRDIRASARTDGLGPTHCNTNLMVKEQTDRSAVVETYMLYIPLDIASLNIAEETLANTRITGTARYIFSMQKANDGVWRIDDYAMTYKQRVVEEPRDA